MKFTFETDDAGEARTVLDAFETRANGAPVNAATAANTVTGIAELAEEVATTQTAAANVKDAGELDSNGMGWSAEIHTDKRTKNADGSWKARKGCADAAKQAVAAFKAGGGGLTAVNTEVAATVTAGGMPGAGAPAGMPTAGGMPGAGTRAVDAVPISQAVLEGKIIGMIERNTLTQDPQSAVGNAAPSSYQHLLDTHQIDRNNLGVLDTNETLRAAVYGSCCQIEPEAPGA